MWCLETSLGGGPGSAGLIAGFDEIRGIFHSEVFQGINKMGNVQEHLCTQREDTDNFISQKSESQSGN